MTGNDQRRAWVATVTALVVVASFVASKAARDAILLSNFGIESLPIFIGISALISLPVIVIAGRLMARFGPGRLMPVLNLISAGLALCEWSLLGTYPGPAAIAVYFHLSISGAILVSGFWSIINERFDVQTAKRHISRIGVGATFGGIFGGLVAQGTAVYLAPEHILLVLAGMQVVCATTLYVVRDTQKAPPSAPRFALGVVTRSRLLRNVAALVVLGAIAACVLDYVFKADIVATTPSGDLLHVLAIYYTVTSVVTAVIQATVCGPLIARLGVPRSVATLPFVVTIGGLTALLAFPSALAAMIARAAETVTRSSIYRAGYELLYAPLPEADKRPTKVMLDVGAERLGDLLGAQLVGVIVFLMVDPRIGLLIAAVAIAVTAIGFALRLPRNYTHELEASLIARDDTEPAPVFGWPIAEAVVGQAGDLGPLPFRILDHTRRRVARPPTPAERDHLSLRIAELRSGVPERIRHALATELTPELAALVIGLVARDDVGREAMAALRAIASRSTGTLVDALVDPTREVVIRRRVAAVLFDGEPTLAAWGLWRGLVDPSFEVRYRCGAVLSQLALAGKLAPVTSETVFEAVKRELDVDPTAWKTQRVVDDRLIATVVEYERDEPTLQHTGSALEHVFTVLGLVLPAEPLRIALHAVQTDDSALRETALEYLQSILPSDLRIRLWPLLESNALVTPPSPPAVRTQDELVAALNHAYPTIRSRLLGKQATPGVIGSRSD